MNGGDLCGIGRVPVGSEENENRVEHKLLSMIQEVPRDDGKELGAWMDLQFFITRNA